jgi:drug/metabolite transporter superfamily protein YnfA
MKQIFAMAESMQKDAWQVINDTNVIDIWSSIGATINLVGSKIAYPLKRR